MLFPQNRANWKKQSYALSPPGGTLPMRLSGLHPHPLPPSEGEIRLVSSVWAPSAYLFIPGTATQFCSPTQGLSRQFLFIFGKGRTASRNWYELKLLSKQPQMLSFAAVPHPNL